MIGSIDNHHDMWHFLSVHPPALPRIRHMSICLSMLQYLTPILSVAPALLHLVLADPEQSSKKQANMSLKLFLVSALLSAAEAFTVVAGIRPTTPLRATAPKAMIAPDALANLLPTTMTLADCAVAYRRRWPLLLRGSGCTARLHVYIFLYV